MPTTIEIPKRHREGLTIINSLPENAFPRLVAALETVVDPNSIDETVPNADLPDVSRYEVETVVQTVLSIYRVRAFRGQALEPFVKDLSAAMEIPVGDMYIAPEQREKFSSRLEKLLSIDRLSTLEERSIDTHALFLELADIWKKDTEFVSTTEDMVLHESYQRIIGLGPSVVPFLLQELDREPDHWFWALKSITRVNPAEDTNTFDDAVTAWLDWGAQRGYIRREVELSRNT